MIKNILTKNYEMTIDQKDFDYVFFDDMNIHGFQLCGIALYEFGVINEPQHIDIYSKLPNEIKNLNASTVLIKKSSILAELKNNTFFPREIEEHDKGYIKMLETIKLNAPELLDDIKHRTWNDYPYEINNFDFIHDISEFVEKLLIDNSQLTINGEKFHLQTQNHYDCDYAKLYFESGKYDDFKNKNK